MRAKFIELSCKNINIFSLKSNFSRSQFMLPKSIVLSFVIDSYCTDNLGIFILLIKTLFQIIITSVLSFPNIYSICLSVCMCLMNAFWNSRTPGNYAFFFNNPLFLVIDVTSKKAPYIMHAELSHFIFLG